MLDPCQLYDLQPIHDRYVYIHYDDIGTQGVDLCQRFHAVGGFADDLAVMRLPVEKTLEALADHYLIVYQKYPQLFHSFASLTGSRICAVTPPPSFSV